MKKAILIVLFLLIYFSLTAIDKKPISSNGDVGYGRCDIHSVKDILSLYSKEELNKIKIFAIVQSRIDKIEGLKKC